MLDKNWRSDWAQFQKSRRREKRKNMPIFEGVLWEHFGRQTEVNLYIDDERLEIRLGEAVITTICAEHMSGYNSENSTITITLRTPYNLLLGERTLLIFGSEDTHNQALEIITQMANEQNNLFGTPPSSDDPLETRSSDDPSETSSSSFNEN